MKKVFVVSFLLLIVLSLTACQNNTDEDKHTDVQLIADQLELAASEVTVDETNVMFKDVEGTKSLTKRPQRVISIYNSYTNLWYESGGTIVGRIESTTELDENAIEDGKENLVGKTNTTVSIELLLDAQPDLVILSASKQSDLIPQLQQNQIPYISMEYDGISDYFKYLKVFSALNDSNAYETTGKKIVSNIAKIIHEVPAENNPKALLIFGATTSLKAYLSNTANGEMLKYLGVKNIGDAWTNEQINSISINEEYVMSEDPEFIFVQSMSNEQKVKELFENTYQEKWASLQALKNDKVIFLERNWYHYKPNSAYDQAFLKLAQIIYPEIFKDFQLD